MKKKAKAEGNHAKKNSRDRQVEDDLTLLALEMGLLRKVLRRRQEEIDEKRRAAWEQLKAARESSRSEI